MNLLSIISIIIGWGYVISWSISLYPPILLNRKLRSVEGMSIDFLFLNMIGYLTYAISISMLFFSAIVRNEYAQRHSLSPNGDLSYPLVRFNDCIYGYHGLILALFCLYQFYCSGYARSSAQRVTRPTQYFLVSCLIGGVLLTSYALIQARKGQSHFQLLDVANIMGNVKVTMSVFKYLPQVLWNMKRKSTKGWSMDSVYLDSIGSVLCLIQLLLDGHLNKNIWGVLNNPVKLTLALITLLFDGVFVFQHYVLYREKEDKGIIGVGKEDS